MDGLREAVAALLAARSELLGVVGLSLLVSGAALFLATLVGVPLGILLGLHRFPGRSLVITLVNTCMGLPPVAVGLVVFLLLARSGPLGGLELLYTPTAMVVAQVVIGAVLAILFGVALANLVRGVPLDASGWFSLTLFTHFRTDEPVGILDWYTILVGVFALGTLTAHGACFLLWKTTGAVEERSRRLALIAFAAVGVLWPVVTWATREASPGAFATFGERPLAWAGAGAAAIGIGTAFQGLRARRGLAAFLGSCAYIGGILGATGAMMFPVLLRATADPARSVTALAAASPASSLRTALVWFSLGAPLALAYFVTLHRLHRGKVVPPEDGHGY